MYIQYQFVYDTIYTVCDILNTRLLAVCVIPQMYMRNHIKLRE
jgi:hypothetical protein